MEVPVWGQEPPKRGSHGVAQALMAARGNLATESEAGIGIQRFGDGLDELFYCRKILRFTIPQVF